MRTIIMAGSGVLLALAGCNVNYSTADGNGSVSAGRNEASGRFEAEVRADGSNVSADFDGRGGADVTVGDTRVNLTDSDLRATIRTGENRSISVTTNGN